MDNLDQFHILLEIIVLVLTLSTQSPLLGIGAAIGFIIFLLSEEDRDNDSNN
jgi:hypothetical protein